MAPDNPANQLAPCPRCHYLDAVLSVPAAFASASTTEAARRVVNDDEASLSRRNAARATVHAALPVVPASQLTMEPINYTAIQGCLGVFLGIFATIMFTSYAYQPVDEVGSWIFLVVGFTAVLGSLLLILRLPLALARRRLVNAGRPAAAAIWTLGWYCCRCAIVYFQAGETPPGIAPSQMLTPAQFQHLVWTAGGYAKPRLPPTPFTS